MNTSELKTTSFLLSEDFFGHVFRYKIGPRFKDAWLRLSDGGKRLLPYASLRTALAAHSNDFVRLDPKNDKWRERDDDWYFFSREKISENLLRRIFKAWEFVVMESEAGETGERRRRVLDRIGQHCRQVRQAARCLPCPPRKDGFGESGSGRQPTCFPRRGFGSMTAQRRHSGWTVRRPC